MQLFIFHKLFRGMSVLGSAAKVGSALLTILGAIAAGMIIAVLLGFNPFVWLLEGLWALAEWLLRAVFF